MKSRKKPVVKKVVDLTDTLEAYRASAHAVGQGPARLGNLALASAAAGGAALALTPAAEATIVYSGPQDIILRADDPPNYSASTLIDVDDDDITDFGIAHFNPGGPYLAAVIGPMYNSVFSTFASVIASYSA